MEQVKVGIIGCGHISGRYLEQARQYPILDVTTCADLIHERAEAQAAKFGVHRACSVKALLDDDAIEIVINLTNPAAHATLALQVIEAGKHLYSEKPLALAPDEGRRILEAARAKGLRVGCAPDTFLGTGHQTCRALIEDGAIGRPVAATAFCLGGGHERWHPEPDFFYKRGAGPLWDMGPYYLTAWLNLLGPMRRVTGIAGIQIPQRTIGSRPRLGQTIEVEVPDHVAGGIEFKGGAIGTIVTSFATAVPVHDADHPITIYGTEDTLAVPDPNRFDGQVRFRRTDGDWQNAATTHTHPNGRSLGVADLAHALRTGRPHRASGLQAFAVLEAMHGLTESSRTGRHFEMSARYEKPALLPPGLGDGILDD